MENFIPLAITALYYIVTALGAVSIGYVVVRLSHPETRLLDEDHKMGYSAVTGFAITACAIAADAAVSGAAAVKAATGFFPLFFFLAAVFSLLGLKAFFAVKAPRFAAVGIPLHPDFSEKYGREIPILVTPEEEEAASAIVQASKPPAQAAPAALSPLSESQRIEIEVHAPEGGAVRPITFEEMYVSVSADEKAAKRRKTLEDLLSKAKEMRAHR